MAVPRAQSSPTSPGGTGVPSGENTLSSVSPTARPQDPGRVSDQWVVVMTGDVSVSPYDSADWMPKVPAQPLDELHRGRSRGRVGHLEGRERLAAARRPQHEAVHDRHAQELGGLLAADELQRLLRPKPAQDERRAAGPEDGQ